MIEKLKSLGPKKIALVVVALVLAFTVMNMTESFLHSMDDEAVATE